MAQENSAQRNEDTEDVVLAIDQLNTQYKTDQGPVSAVDGVSLELKENQTLGVIGESGSGKTTLAESINRTFDQNAEIVDGSITLDGVDLTELSDGELREYLWEEISLIPQSSMNSLDPVYTVGEQIVEVILEHEDVSKADARERAKELFDLIGIDEEHLKAYPHQLSGGMKQRAMIALALALNPSVLIADEPTTALDVIIQDRILNKIMELQQEFDTSMILVTHDISVVSETSDEIGVMYAGRLVEYGPTESVITNPHHPYTMGLRNAFPDILEEDDELIAIPGKPPDLTTVDDGCRFAGRCPFAQDECYEEEPQSEEIMDGHFVECHRADEVEMLQEEAKYQETWERVKE